MEGRQTPNAVPRSRTFALEAYLEHSMPRSKSNTTSATHTITSDNARLGIYKSPLPTYNLHLTCSIRRPTALCTPHMECVEIKIPRCRAKTLLRTHSTLSNGRVQPPSRTHSRLKYSSTKHLHLIGSRLCSNPSARGLPSKS